MEAHRGVVTLLAPNRFVCVIVAPGFLNAQPPEIRICSWKAGVRSTAARKTRWLQLSQVETSGGALAIVHQPTWDQAAVLAQPTMFGRLYGDMLQDPANIGTIIRTAAGLM